MPFKYLMDILRGNDTRLDRIEERLSSIECTLLRCSMPHEESQGREEIETSGTKRINVRRPGRPETRNRRIQRARTVYGPDGWHVSEQERGLMSGEFGKDWIIEFDCPSCGRSCSGGVRHIWTEFERDHTNYIVRLRCRQCGWESGEVNIRGYK